MASAMQRFVRLTPRHDRQTMTVRRLAKKQSIRGVTPGGFTLAFVGADGAGKSSTVAAVDEWLSWKLTVRRYYMGIPKSRRTRMLNLSIRGCAKLRLHSLVQNLNSLKWIYCARERFLNHRRAGEHRSRGGIVIFDRYPLPELWDKPEPMDGPRIDAQSRWASAEMSYYDAIEPPDYVFVLQVTYEESMRRKKASSKQQNYESLRRKIDAISTLEGDGQQVFIFDTTVGVERSLMNIKRQIWKLLG